MATVKVKWRLSANTDKPGTIYYRVIHNRVVRQLKTNYKVFANEWNGESLLISRDRSDERMRTLWTVHERIDWDLKRLLAIIAKFNGRNRPYTADEIVAEFVSQFPKQSFFVFMQHVIVNLKLLHKDRTAENYLTTLNSFVQFRHEEDLRPDEINTDVMMQYEAYLMGRGVAKNTVSFYMRILRAVYNRTVEQGLTEQRRPFRHVYTGIDKTVKRAISFNAVKRIKALDLSQYPTLDFARDMFLFSFYTRGMSFVDMAYLKKDDLKHGVLSYRRRKTGQLLSVGWERHMQEIITKYEAYNCYRPIPKDGLYLLPILQPPFDNHRNQYKTMLQQINKSLKKVAQMAQLCLPLTMYVARHSWASIARSKNIPIAVISEGMGHDSEKTTQIYLASLDTAVIDHANSVVLKGL